MLKPKLFEHTTSALVAGAISGVITLYGILSSAENSKSSSFNQASQLLAECQRVVGDLNDRNRPNSAEAHKESFRVLFDTGPFIAWIKKYDPDSNEFRMWIINKNYSETYNLGRQRYEGKADYEIWPPKIAKVYAKNDALVLGSRGCITVYEPDNSEIDHLIPVVKCYMALGDDEFVLGFTELVLQK